MSTGYEEIIAETHSAILLRIGELEEIWFPKSKCVIDKEDKIIYMSPWLAEEKGLV